jgi:centromere protein J
VYPTGTRKEILPNGVQTVIFANGDVKQTGVDRRVVYFYSNAKTTHVSDPDGTQLYHFPNGQVVHQENPLLILISTAQARRHP